MCTLLVRPKKVRGVVVQSFDCYIGDETKNDNWDLPTSKWANTSGKRDEESLRQYQDGILEDEKLFPSLFEELQGKMLGAWDADPQTAMVMSSLNSPTFLPSQHHPLSLPGLSVASHRYPTFTSTTFASEENALIAYTELINTIGQSFLRNTRWPSPL